jgi:hypothetical protein
MSMTLSAVGLGWHDAGRFIDERPELAWRDAD